MEIQVAHAGNMVNHCRMEFLVPNPKRTYLPLMQSIMISYSTSDNNTNNRIVSLIKMKYSHVKKHQYKYIFLLGILILAPISRELLFGIFSHHHYPFSSSADIVHTISEVVFMCMLGLILIYIDNKYLVAKTRELRITQSVAIEALASLAEYRDAETSEHLLRMREFVKILTKRLLESSPYRTYLSSQSTYIEDLSNAAVLHDIGKIAISDSILLKPSALTDEEFNIIKTHTTIGADILMAADNQFQQRIGKQSYLTLAQSVAKYHHEKWNGQGYPHSLCGEQIPLSARIVALCDVYDAVTSDRIYKKAWSHNEAVKLIREESGKHFDPVLIEAFLKIDLQFQAIKEK